MGIHREWLLRMPSLMALLLAAAILFDLARRWFSRRVAIAALVFFCVQPWVVFAAADARPYAFGLLAVVLSTWLMLRWLEMEGAGYACAYGVVAGLMMHFQMLFEPSWFSTASFSSRRRRGIARRCGRARWRFAFWRL